MKTYLKDLTLEEIIRRLKAREVVKNEKIEEMCALVNGCMFKFRENDALIPCLFYWDENSYFETLDELKLEVGKCYKTRDGRKAFVSSYNSSTKYCRGAVIDFLNLAVWTENGLYLYATESGLDLVSEWSDDHE